MGEDRHKNCCNDCVESITVLHWAQLALDGDPVSDFAESYPAVRAAKDVRMMALAEGRRAGLEEAVGVLDDSRHGDEIEELHGLMDPTPKIPLPGGGSLTCFTQDQLEAKKDKAYAEGRRAAAPIETLQAALGSLVEMRGELIACRDMIKPFDVHWTTDRAAVVIEKVRALVDQST